MSYQRGCHLDFPSLLFSCPSRSPSQVLRLETQRILGSPWEALGTECSQAQHKSDWGAWCPECRSRRYWRGKELPNCGCHSLQTMWDSLGGGESGQRIQGSSKTKQNNWGKQSQLRNGRKKRPQKNLEEATKMASATPVEPWLSLFFFFFYRETSFFYLEIWLWPAEGM